MNRIKVVFLDFLRWMRKDHGLFAQFVFIGFVLTQKWPSEDSIVAFVESSFQQLIALFFVSASLILTVVDRRKSSRESSKKFSVWQSEFRTDLQKYSNPLFVQFRSSSVQHLSEEDFDTESISKAIVSNEWWDYSYFVANAETKDELILNYAEKENLTEPNERIETSCLVLTTEDIHKKDYFFLGHISYDKGQGFPPHSILDLENTKYQIKLERLYTYNTFKRFGRLKKLKRPNVSFTTDKVRIEEIYNRLLERQRLVESMNVSWDTEGNKKYTGRNKSSSVGDFLDRSV